MAPSVPLPASSFTAITQGLTGYGWNLSSRAHLKRCLDVAQVILHRKSSQRPLPAAVMAQNKAGIREDKFRVVLREPEDGCESAAITVSFSFIMIQQ